MKIQIVPLQPHQRTSRKDTHRLWLDSYYQDIDRADLEKLKREADEALRKAP